MLGVLAGFREKLEGPSAEPFAEGVNTSSEALLRMADLQLKAFVASRYPRLTTRWWGGGYRDRESYGAGKTDGSSITLHRGLTHRAGNRGLNLPRTETQ
jgi:hypothetical protein